jgi:hypothetical protein
MSGDAGVVGRCVSDARRRIGRTGALLGIVGLALTFASPAWATPTATATLAPIGTGSTGSYLVTVTNTGSETIELFIVGAEATSFVPASCNTLTVGGGITCPSSLATGATAQLCYTGPAATVASCPLAGFKPGSGSGGGSGTATSPTRCVVPSVKGKTLASAEKAIVAAHCGVGKIKKTRSNHVKKGRVISQGTARGTTLASGAKVNLIISKGK